MAQSKHPRPKWAKKLSRDSWKHLREVQEKDTPTLRDLKTDATTCDDCRRILAGLAA